MAIFNETNTRLINCTYPININSEKRFISKIMGSNSPKYQMLSWPFPTILVFYLPEKRRFSGIENIKIVKQAKKMSAISDKGLK